VRSTTSSGSADAGVPGAARQRPIVLTTIGTRLLSAAAYLVSALLALAILAPVAVSFWGAMTTSKAMGTASEVGPGWQSSAASGGGVFAERTRAQRGFFTLLWYRYVFRVYGRTILFTLQLAVVSVVLTTVIGVAASYALVRYRFRGQALVEEVVLLPMSIPGIAVAIALIQAHTTLRPTWYIILVGHLLYTMPFMIRAVTNTLRSFDFVALEEAAASLGATWWQRMRWVILPNLKHAILIGSLLVFAISLGEFNASFLLNTPINQTYPAVLYDTYNLDSFQVSSAATTIFMVMLFPALLALQYVGGRELEEAGQGA
jgi:putative spermidine/putrescine transport system permease protein